MPDKPKRSPPLPDLHYTSPSPLPEESTSKFTQAASSRYGVEPPDLGLRLLSRTPYERRRDKFGSIDSDIELGNEAVRTELAKRLQVKGK